MLIMIDRIIDIIDYEKKNRSSALLDGEVKRDAGPPESALLCVCGGRLSRRSRARSMESC